MVMASFNNNRLFINFFVVATVQRLDDLNIFPFSDL